MLYFEEAVIPASHRRCAQAGIWIPCQVHSGFAVAARNDIRTRRNTMENLKITAIGNSLGIILPKELLAKLRVEKGDLLSVTETPGGIKLSTYDEGFEHQMTIARKVMRKNRNLLKKLAE
jgi:putative addiction module antidote